MPPPSTSRKPLRYRPSSRARERRQVEPAPEADEDFTSGSEDEFESDSDYDDEPLPPATATATGSSALTTFRVDNGGVIATALPDGSVDVEPPVNAVVPDTEVGGVTEIVEASPSEEATVTDFVEVRF